MQAKTKPSPKTRIRKVVFSALFLAIGLVLPFLTGQIPEIGSRLSPLHIPVLLCGFLCGWKWGMTVGIILPLMRSVLFGMPPILPTAVAMAFELAAYGCVAGLLGKRTNVYIALLSAMIAGRAVWGLAAYLLNTALGAQFTWQMFLAGAFLNAIPGIILHIVLLPLIILALRKAGYIDK